MVVTCVKTSSATDASWFDGLEYLPSRSLVAAYTWFEASLMHAKRMASLFFLAEDLSFSSVDWIDLILSSAAVNLSLGDGKPEAAAVVRRMMEVAKYFFIDLLYQVVATSCIRL